MRLTFLFFTLLFLAACSSLNPVSREAEITNPSADNPLWAAIREAQPGEWQVILNNGPQALDWRLKAIDSASESIDLQTFLWSPDTTGLLIEEHLIRAAERGVKIKLLVDDTFIIGEEGFIAELIDNPNIEYRVFNPYKRRSDNLLTREILNLFEFQRLNHRMHNKAMIIDKRLAIVGGRNLADEYFGLDETVNFRDMELMVGGPVINGIADTFDNYWNDQWSFPIEEIIQFKPSSLKSEDHRLSARPHSQIHEEINQQSLIESFSMLVKDAYQGKVKVIADDPPGDDPADESSAPVQLANSLESYFNQARENIVLVSAYLIPAEDIETSIYELVEKGVTIQLLTNSIQSNNHLAAHSSYRNHITTLLKNGAELHELRVDAQTRERYILPPIENKSLALHAKVLILDHDKTFIGSPNFDPRSLRMNTEMGLLVESEALNRAVRSDYAIDFDLDNAWQLTLDENDRVIWQSDTETRTSQPAASFMQRLEDWFFAHLPIEAEM